MRTETPPPVPSQHNPTHPTAARHTEGDGILNSPKQSTPYRLACASVLASGALAGLPAAAESDPYYLGASARYTHHSNVTQAGVSSASSSDNVLSTSLFAGLDQPFGRQRVRADAMVDHNNYQSSSALNNVSYRVSGGLDWSTIERLSGNVSAYSARSLAQYAVDGIAASTSERTLVRTDGFSTVARMGVVTRLTLEGNYAHDRTRYSGPAAAISTNFNNDRDTLGASLRYQFSSAMMAGLGLRYTEGDYPGRATANHYKRNDIDFPFGYTPSAITSFQGRVSLTKTRYNNATAFDLSGVTGTLTWLWQVTGKTSISTSYDRDSGREASLVRTTVGGPLLLDDQSRVNNTLRTQVKHQLTGKVSTYAGAAYTRRDTVSSVSSVTTPTTVSLVPGSDNLRQFTLGAHWEATRAINAGCDLSLSTRNTGAGNYDYNSVGCQVRVTLR